MLESGAMWPQYIWQVGHYVSKRTIPWKLEAFCKKNRLKGYYYTVKSKRYLEWNFEVPQRHRKLYIFNIMLWRKEAAYKFYYLFCEFGLEYFLLYTLFIIWNILIFIFSRRQGQLFYALCVKIRHTFVQIHIIFHNLPSDFLSGSAYSTEMGLNYGCCN